MAAASMTAMKKELRKKIKVALSELSEPSCAMQSSNAVKVLLATPEYKAAQRISVYLSMPSGEISTAGIVRDALEQGKKVFVPYTYHLTAPKDDRPKSIMDMVELKSLSDYELLEQDKWDIPTPGQDSIPSRANSFGGTGTTEGEIKENSGAESGLDLIVMPGLAFDANFGRLGHGKGFYDYFLQRCHQSSRMPFRVGLSLCEQFLNPASSVPMDDTDFRLDALILGSGEIRRNEK